MGTSAIPAPPVWSKATWPEVEQEGEPVLVGVGDFQPIGVGVAVQSAGKTGEL